MALVRGVICLFLSDWAPAVASSLAPLRSPRPATPHLSQMGGRMDGARRRGERDRNRGKDEEKDEGSYESQSGTATGNCVTQTTIVFLFTP